MKLLLAGLVATALLSGTAAAEDGNPPLETRSSPRILWGQHGDTDYKFNRLGPLRRSDASPRQAYFGSGEEYSETLERLQGQLQRMAARERLAGLELSPAQEAAKEEMSPALMRALALSQGSRRQDAAATEDN